MDHDHSYKLLFSHPEMIADLLRGFVHEDWVAALDFSTLERVNASYVSDHLKGRADDVVWRVRWGREALYVYLLLEFQSSVDRHMALRLMAYLALLYQDLVRAGELGADQRLPPVLPLVLYNGDGVWRAATDVADLVTAAPPGLDRYRPRLKYLLLDQSALDEKALAERRNLAAALFRLERSRTPADVGRVVEALIEWLGAPEQASLRRAFTVWLAREFLPARLPGQSVPEVRDLKEVRTMLSERVKEWTLDWKQQGIEEGREIGLAEGRQEGEALLLLRLWERRFGPASESVRRRIREADSDTLLTWSERILDARTPEDVLGPEL